MSRDLQRSRDFIWSEHLCLLCFFVAIAVADFLLKKANMPTSLKHFLSRPKLVIPIVAAAVLANNSNTAVKAAPRPLDVEVVQVKQDDVPLYSEWIGTTEGIVNADIKAQVTGYLLRQDYKEGSFVKKGELLFEIDPRPFQAVLDQANGQLAQFEGQLEQANSQVVEAEAQVAQATSRL